MHALTLTKSLIVLKSVKKHDLQETMQEEAPHEQATVEDAQFGHVRGSSIHLVRSKDLASSFYKNQNLMDKYWSIFECIDKYVNVTMSL